MIDPPTFFTFPVQVVLWVALFAFVDEGWRMWRTRSGLDVRAVTRRAIRRAATAAMLVFIFHEMSLIGIDVIVQIALIVLALVISLVHVIVVRSCRLSAEKDAS